MSAAQTPRGAKAPRFLIVDDEAAARAELRYVLERVDGTVRADEASSAAEALAALDAWRYDTVFLDIRMPGLSGLDALSLIEGRPHRPDVVFVTAYDEYALKAFELAAADYLLKPVSEVRLRRALDRLRMPRRSAGPPREARPTVGKLPVQAETATLFLRLADIRYVHVRGHDTFAKTFDREHRTRFSLGELEARLATHGFVRVHRAHLVNVEHILELEPFFAGSQLLRVDDRERTELPVSRSAAPRLREILGL